MSQGSDRANERIFVCSPKSNWRVETFTTSQVIAGSPDLGRLTSFTRDALGNVTSTTRLSGTSGAVTTATEYDARFSLPTRITDANSNAIQYGYDHAGNRVSVIDGLNNETTATFNSQGQMLTVTDPNGHTTSFGYSRGDLISITDALGNTRRWEYDAVGRVIAQTDALGAKTLFAVDVMERLVGRTDPNGAQVQFAYDANGNSTLRTDANNHDTAFDYDDSNRLVSSTDPLTHSDGYEYDVEGRVSQYIDRKGQLTAYERDSFGRPTFIGFGASSSSPTSFTSTITQTWDDGGRLTDIDDSIAGTISRTFDGLDRLLEEETPGGSVNYTYDAAGRRATMTAAGHPTISYTYNAANRLVLLQQAAGTINGNAAQSVAFDYDDGGRLIHMELPNGVDVLYDYDDANHVTAITYKHSNGTTLGDITYSYDAAGRRVSVGGSLAPTVLPSTAQSATYDAANRLTVLNSVNLTYDGRHQLAYVGCAESARRYLWGIYREL